MISVQGKVKQQQQAIRQTGWRCSKWKCLPFERKRDYIKKGQPDEQNGI